MPSIHSPPPPSSARWEPSVCFAARAASVQRRTSNIEPRREEKEPALQPLHFDVGRWKFNVRRSAQAAPVAALCKRQSAMPPTRKADNPKLDSDSGIDILLAWNLSMIHGKAISTRGSTVSISIGPVFYGAMGSASWSLPGPPQRLAKPLLRKSTGHYGQPSTPCAVWPYVSYQ